MPTVAVMTDLWPSRSQPHSGAFVEVQVAASAGAFRPLVLVPRLLAPRVHRRVWGDAVEGWQRDYAPAPGDGSTIAYPMARLPKVGESAVRARSARLLLALRRERPKLVHGHFLLNAGSAAVRLARLLGTPSVVTAHGTDVRWLDEGGLPKRLEDEMLGACRGADRVIVVAEPMRATLADRGVDPAKIAVIPMGVDGRIFHLQDRVRARAALGLPEGEPVVVFVGRAVPEKGSQVLADALVELRRRERPVRCLHAGPAGSPLGECDELGVLPPNELAEVVAAADVLCLPSFGEGTPVSVAEALAVGTPVVATSVGGIPDQVREGRDGLLVPPGDPGRLADALDAALSRSWDHAVIAADGARFTAAALAPGLEEIYLELLA
jgi:glycosyltransferase involved in cell wall biosynthesis